MAARRPNSRGVGCVRRREGRFDGRAVPRPSDRRRVRGDRREDALQQRARRRRAAGDRDVDRDHVGDAAEARVALAEDAAGAAAIADGDDELRLGRRVVGALAARSPCASTPGPVTSSMSAWRGLATKRDAEAFDVVVRIAERVDLELAAVARAGVDVADRQRAAERAQDRLLQARDDDASRRPARAAARS